MDPKQSKSDGHNHRLLPTLIFTGLALFGIVGAIIYLRIWQQGDSKAQALSGLLAFIAAIVSSVVTLVYVYLTNASLRTAQASIDLQRDQLEQMKSSVDLQQREWEQKVRVFPQFWITSEGDQSWRVRNPSRPSLNRDMHFRRGFRVNVWNYSEQSFLIESIGLQRLDLVMPENRRTVSEQVVVRPHSVEKLDISLQMLQLLTQTPAGNKPPTDMMGLISKRARIFLRLIYSDWSQKHAETEIREFEFTYNEGELDIGISQPPTPSGLQPSI